MSLAPVAYLLFQKVMRHNPSNTNWPGRDLIRAVVDTPACRSTFSSTSGGFGLELDDIKAYRFWGSRTRAHQGWR